VLRFEESPDSIGRIDERIVIDARCRDVVASKRSLDETLLKDHQRLDVSRVQRAPGTDDLVGPAVVPQIANHVDEHRVSLAR